MVSLTWLSVRSTALLASLSQLAAGGVVGRGPAEVLDISTPIRSPILRPVERALPETAKVHKYNFTISREHRAPDGLNRSLILVNGQFPGPTIEGNLGDYFEVTVTNQISSPAEGTSIHWHGQPQKETPQYDGVPFIAQCPIAPGTSFTYRFRAEAAGTTMYHSHFSAQYMDGVFGGLIIHGPRAEKFDIDMGPIFLTDYSHTDYLGYLLRVYDIPPTFLPIENNLINGRNDYDCSLEEQGRSCTPNATLSQYEFKPGKKHLLRLINAGGSSNQKFSIDGHKLTVVANDFVQVQPYETDVVTLGIGQRSDVIVTATEGATDAFWMRSELDVPCQNGTVHRPLARAIVYYEDADRDILPDTEGHAWESTDCLNDPLETTIPLDVQPVPEPSFTQQLDITAAPNATGHLVFAVNNITFRANYSASLLHEASVGNSPWLSHPEYHVLDYSNQTSVRMVVRNLFPVMHNMHLHGHADFWILAEGRGEWDGEITRAENPQRRDSAQLSWGTPELPAYLVIQFNVDNPGVWSFHCHLVVHASAGLYTNVLELPEKIDKEATKKVVDQTCPAWEEFVKHNPINQFDSGLKVRGLDLDKFKRRDL
ncbi:putative multicopper oxidase [Corynespora cassiicola Philippines]|uniref:Putative multicopper oxidase n=1 Tax=Corynespora cassiicola Philippines TaxID=1448308 RepID=A0A2T2PDC5_CORCC|nr:putative multicopper oxidase [Corynespora cassiicola Philippines]